MKFCIKDIISLSPYKYYHIQKKDFNRKMSVFSLKQCRFALSNFNKDYKYSFHDKKDLKILFEK